MAVKKLLFLFSVITVVSGILPNKCVSADDARLKAAHRQRRITFNNDGDDAWNGGAPATKEGFLSLRMDHIGDCGVDSVFYCTSRCLNMCTHDSKVTEVMTTKEGGFKFNRMSELIALGTDPLQLAIESCRQKNIEIFWTMRMNDVHDFYVPELKSQWKKDHPEMLIGTLEESAPYKDKSDDPRQIGTWADFAHPEVCEVTLRTIKDVLDRYDVDGIDLDFMRHPCYFKETRRMEPVTPEHRDILTDLVSRIREAVLAASQRKGKPILLSARILPTVALNQKFGFDMEKWITGGYLDFITTGCGYDPFTMPAEMIDRGHAWGVPVYRCLSDSGMTQELVSDSDLVNGNIAAWRGAASNAWHDGVDGIMTFNLFPNGPGTQTPMVRTAWQQMGDSKGLVGRDKLFCIEHLHYDNWSWMLGSCPREGRLPVTLNPGDAVTRMLPVGDDIASLTNRVETLRLRVFLDFQAGDNVEVTINGTRLNTAPEKPFWLAADVPPAIMKSGPNELMVRFASGITGSLVLRSVELKVKYK